MKRDQSNRICLDKALLPLLQAEAKKLHYDDVAGIVNHLLRLILAGQTVVVQSPKSTPKKKNEEPFLF